MSVSYSALLTTNKNFNKLFYGQTLSVLGDWFHTVALLTFVYSITESPFMIALTFISKGLPQLLLSPFIGGVVDRFSKKNIMIFTDITRGILVLTYIHTYSQAIKLKLFSLLIYVYLYFLAYLSQLNKQP
ncbi:hypothetical protein BC30052_1611 [Bacillus cereus]|nr:hypothetical protein BC30052_1611 [Bacillus cereus]